MSTCACVCGHVCCGFCIVQKDAFAFCWQRKGKGKEMEKVQHREAVKEKMVFFFFLFPSHSTAQIQQETHAL